MQTPISLCLEESCNKSMCLQSFYAESNYNWCYTNTDRNLQPYDSSHRKLREINSIQI